jgi:hypothetical protein
MGIKFRCPNGHKINVKSHQAGKKGFCPKCKIQVDIPLKSQRKGKAERAAERAAAKAGTSNRPTAPAQPGPDMPVATRIVSSAGMPTVTLPTAPSSAANDPIAANPELVWYVRPPNGNQFGPAKGELLLSWIKEGRVGPDSLVWQEGWPDWKPAAETFPQLAAPPDPMNNLLAGTPDSLPEFSFTNPASNQVSAESNGTARRLNSRRKSTSSTPIIVSFLTVVAVVLIVILIWVLNPK